MDSMISRGIMGIATALLLLSGPAIAATDSPWSAVVKIGMNGNMGANLQRTHQRNK